MQNEPSAGYPRGVLLLDTVNNRHIAWLTVHQRDRVDAYIPDVYNQILISPLYYNVNSSFGFYLFNMNLICLLSVATTIV